MKLKGLSFILFSLFIFITGVASTPCNCPFREIPTLSGTDPSFGSSVSINKNVLAVGAPQTSGKGVVAIYTRFDDFPYWTYRTNITSGTANTNFGTFVAVATDSNVLVSENTVTSSTHVIYSFERSGPNTWIQVISPFKLNDCEQVYGMSAYSDLLVVSARLISGSFVAYIYSKSGYDWKYVTALVNIEEIEFTNIAVGGDTTFVASTASGNIYIYSYENYDWDSTPPVILRYGKQINSIAYTPDTNYITISFTDSVLVLNLTTNVTTTLTSFSSALPFVNISNAVKRQNYLVITDYGQSSAVPLPDGSCTSSVISNGALYVFTQTPSTNDYVPLSFLRPAVQETSFGSSLSFSTNQGDIIVVGTNSNRVHTFIASNSITPLASCVSPTPSKSSSPKKQASSSHGV